MTRNAIIHIAACLIFLLFRSNSYAENVDSTAGMIEADVERIGFSSRAVSENFVGSFDIFGFDLDKDELSIFACRKHKNTVNGEWSYKIHPEDKSRIAELHKKFGSVAQSFAASPAEIEIRISVADGMLVSRPVVGDRFVSKKEKFEKITMLVRPIEFKNIKAMELFLPINLWTGKQAVARLIAPQSKENLVGFSTFSRCPRVGYEPGALTVIINPDELDSLKSFTSQNSSMFDAPLTISAITADEDANSIYKNVFRIFPLIGKELFVMRELKNKSWVIDVNMEPVPYGPPAVFIDLMRTAAETLFAKSDINANEIFQVIKQAFPTLRDAWISGEDGSYMLTAPVTELFPSLRDFKGYWIYARFEIFGFWQPSITVVGADTFRIAVILQDGYLPKFPANVEVPPPLNAHVRQSHLDQEAVDKFHDFFVLKKIIDAINRYFIKTAGAKIYNPLGEP